MLWFMLILEWNNKKIMFNKNVYGFGVIIENECMSFQKIIKLAVLCFIMTILTSKTAFEVLIPTDG